MNHPIVNHHDFGLWTFVVTIPLLAISWIAANTPLLQGIASIVTALAGGISIYFAFRNRKK